MLNVGVLFPGNVARASVRLHMEVQPLDSLKKCLFLYELVVFLAKPVVDSKSVRHIGINGCLKSYLAFRQHLLNRLSLSRRDTPLPA